MRIVIPGYAEAVKQERSIRDQSFLDLPEAVCGVEVQPLTLRRMVLLESIGSPFVCGGPVTPYHVGAFFVALTGATGLKRWRLLRRVGLMNTEELVAAITGFMDETFQDSPPGSSEGISYYSNAAGLVDFAASQYGWPEDDILDIPLRRLFQYVKATTHRLNPSAIQFNPSDRVRGNYLKEQNALSGRN